MILGSIIVTLEADETGDLNVAARVEGTLQYVTAMGMLEMAKPILDDLLDGADDE